MSGLDVMTRPVWDIVTEEGGRSIVVNVPTTYPPEPLNGMMITGMLTPGLGSDFTHPLSLKEELLAELPDYIIEPARHPDKRVRARDFRRANKMHEQAVHFLLKRGEWDFLMVVFSVLDRAQHDFWADMDAAHPRHDPRSPAELRDFIRETYEWLDGAIGRLVERLPANSRVFIVSDHGFCAELMEIRVNELLAGCGLLRFKGARRARAALTSAKEKVARRVTSSAHLGGVLDRKVHYGGAFLDEIDWSRTSAYFAQDKGVWVNLVGRDPEGIVAAADFDRVACEAQAALTSIVEDGNPVFRSILRRADAFRGRYSERLPDVVMVPRLEGYVYNERPSYGDPIVAADSTTGTHSREGVFIAWGRGISNESVSAEELNLRDVGPTALYSLGCPLPEDLDGRLLSEVFSEPPHPGVKGSAYKTTSPTRPAGAYDEGEESALRERLKALGYID